MAFSPAVNPRQGKTHFYAEDEKDEPDYLRCRYYFKYAPKISPDTQG